MSAEAPSPANIRLSILLLPMATLFAASVISHLARDGGRAVAAGPQREDAGLAATAREPTTEPHAAAAALGALEAPAQEVADALAVPPVVRLPTCDGAGGELAARLLERGAAQELVGQAGVYMAELGMRPGEVTSLAAAFPAAWLEPGWSSTLEDRTRVRVRALLDRFDPAQDAVLLVVAPTLDDGSDQGGVEVGRRRALALGELVSDVAAGLDRSGRLEIRRTIVTPPDTAACDDPSVPTRERSLCRARVRATALPLGLVVAVPMSCAGEV